MQVAAGMEVARYMTTCVVIYVATAQGQGGGPSFVTVVLATAQGGRTI